MIILELQEDKINRQVTFLHAQIFSAGDITGKNNTWCYNRAPDGYKFILVGVEVSTAKGTTPSNIGIYNIVDGHEYTHWNIFPGVESKEVLARGELSDYVLSGYHDLHNWECKEYTKVIRSNSGSQPFKACFIVWYYLRKMNYLEKLQYAVIQARGQRIRKGGPTTVERSEYDD